MVQPKFSFKFQIISNQFTEIYFRIKTKLKYKRIEIEKLNQQNAPSNSSKYQQQKYFTSVLFLARDEEIDGNIDLRFIIYHLLILYRVMIALSIYQK